MVFSQFPNVFKDQKYHVDVDDWYKWIEKYPVVADCVHLWAEPHSHHSDIIEGRNIPLTPQP